MNYLKARITPLIMDRALNNQALNYQGNNEHVNR